MAHGQGWGYSPYSGGMFVGCKPYKNHPHSNNTGLLAHPKVIPSQRGGKQKASNFNGNHTSESTCCVKYLMGIGKCLPKTT